MLDAFARTAYTMLVGTAHVHTAHSSLYPQNSIRHCLIKLSISDSCKDDAPFRLVTRAFGLIGGQAPLPSLLSRLASPRCRSYGQAYSMSHLRRWRA